MSSPMMDNPFVPQLSTKPQLHKLVQNVVDCVGQLKQEFEEDGTPVTDDSQTLHKLCAKLEHLLQAEMKERVSLMGRRKTYWEYFCECLSANKGLRDGLKYVKSLKEYRTSLGKGRALIRFALMHKRLADTIQQCVANGQITSEWYHGSSPWLQHRHSSLIINTLYDLNNMNFDLIPSGYDLDNCWPSFARKTGGAYSWNPPSRSSSMNSLLSSPVHQDADVADGDYDRSQAESESMQHSELLTKIIELEEDRFTADQEVTCWKIKLAELEKQYTELKQKYSTLVTISEAKQSDWETREKALSSQKDKLFQEFRILKEKMLEKEEQHQKLVDEKQSEVIRLEKSELELATEVGKLNWSLQSKEASSGKSETYIQSLEARVHEIESKNMQLLGSMESVLVDKNSEVSKRVGFTDQHLESLVNKLESISEQNILLQKQSEERSHQCDKLEVEMTRKIYELEENIGELNQTNASLSLKVKGLMKNEEESKKKAEDMHRDLKNKTSILAENESLLAEKSEEINRLTNITEEKQTEILKLSDQLLQLSLTASSKTMVHNSTEMADLIENIELLNEEPDAIKMKIGFLKKYYGEQIYKLIEENQKYKDLESQSQDLLDQEKRMLEQTSSVERLNCASQNDEKLMDTILMMIESNCLNFEIDNLSCFNEVKLKDVAVKLLRKMKSLLEQLESKEVHTLALQSSIQSMEESVSMKDVQILDMKRQLTGMRTDLEKLQSSMTEMFSNLEETDLKMKERDKQIKHISHELLETQGKNDLYKMQIKELENRHLAEVNELKEIVNSANEKVQQAADASKDMEQKQQKNGECIQQVEKALKEKHLIVEALQEENSCMKTSLDLLKEVENKMREENASLSQSVDSLQQKLLESRNRCESLSMTVEANHTQMSMLEDLVAKCQSSILEAESTISQLKHHQELNKDFHTKIIELESENKQLNESISKTKTDLETAELNIESLITNLSCIEKERDELLTKQETLATKLLNAQSELEALNLDCSALKDECEYARGELEKLYAEQDVKKERFLAVVSESKIELEKQFSGLMIKKEIVEKEKDTLLANVKVLQAEKDQLVTELDDKNSNIAEKSQKVQELESMLESSSKKYTSEIELLKQELSALQFQFSAQQLQHQQTLKNISMKDASVEEVICKFENQEKIANELKEENGKKENSNRELKKQLGKTRDDLKTTQQECELLQRRLTKADKTEQLHKELKLQFQSSEKLIEQKNQEIDILKEDLHGMKKRLIKLIKEKDYLWKQTDRLEYQQRVDAMRIWTDASDVTHCLKCKAEFSFMLRKHHCRLCGQIFCNNCSDNWKMTPHSSKKIRVCSNCFKQQTPESEKTASAILTLDIDDEEDVYKLRSPKWSESTSDVSDALDHNDVLDELIRSNHFDTMQSDAETNRTIVQSNGSQRPSCKASDGSDQQNSPRSQISSTCNLDSFQVINDDEVVRMRESEENEAEQGANMPTYTTVNLDELDRGQINSQHIIWIQPGSTFTLGIIVSQKTNANICWEFTSHPKDIAFGVSYRSEKSESANVKALVPVQKCPSHKNLIEGQLGPRYAGIYEIIFDNTYSRVTSKRITYKLKVLRLQSPVSSNE